ncbi:uncharacterized protein EKO05_0009087 [Ascochyta rabiei]|uniref:Uncharacterized protein n=1 Tax=Didymella rabiei TaxID=5454 RepID=A0A163INN9_DIDRA|nr:uncharacterized protein EKO05_0009087 [Ascochyta rabiei]KZM25846.1 hypothetical protein ST47_g2883 [Ascochyta rabiei]UPX18795.1 hypothetical protein EKO05_0009087 [Ascochyta rabiei]
MSAIQAIQVISISTALFASGGIASLSAFDIPLMRSQPASRSLPMLRWLFSRGSHTAPTAIIISSTGFLYLAYAALPGSAHTASALLTHLTRGGKPSAFLGASVLSFSCALFTGLAMLPTNFDLISRNEQLGGSHSADSAAYRRSVDAEPRTAEESVNAKDDISQWSDVSDPQEKTARGSSKEQDKEVKALLTRFQKLNYVRAALIGAGGIVGLIGALA